jgi:hypothetical protein
VSAASMQAARVKTEEKRTRCTFGRRDPRCRPSSGCLRVEPSFGDRPRGFRRTSCDPTRRKRIRHGINLSTNQAPEPKVSEGETHLSPSETLPTQVVSPSSAGSNGSGSQPIQRRRAVPRPGAASSRQLRRRLVVRRQNVLRPLSSQPSCRARPPGLEVGVASGDVVVIGEGVAVLLLDVRGLGSSGLVLGRRAAPGVGEDGRSDDTDGRGEVAGGLCMGAGLFKCVLKDGRVKAEVLWKDVRGFQEWEQGQKEESGSARASKTEEKIEDGRTGVSKETSPMIRGQSRSVALGRELPMERMASAARRPPILQVKRSDQPPSVLVTQSSSRRDQLRTCKLLKGREKGLRMTAENDLGLLVASQSRLLCDDERSEPIDESINSNNLRPRERDAER